MPTYEKKPETIDAVQFTGQIEIVDVIHNKTDKRVIHKAKYGCDYELQPGTAILDSPAGITPLKLNDYIVYSAGSKTVWPKEYFEARYRLVK